MDGFRTFVQKLSLTRLAISGNVDHHVDSHSHLIPTFCDPHRITLNYYNMDHNAHIEAAITDLRSQRRTNFTTTAKKWNLERTILAKRFRGETGIKLRDGPKIHVLGRQVNPTLRT
jgi:hypothetical protein